MMLEMLVSCELSTIPYKDNKFHCYVPCVERTRKTIYHVGTSFGTIVLWAMPAAHSLEWRSEHDVDKALLG